ncbi:MAG TPA: DUF4468 domain-containing protein [Cytophagaceae bacterium]|jgi:hypothetical protein
MMNFLLPVLISLSYTCFAQIQIDQSTGLIKNERILQLDSMNQKHIYNKSKVWIASQFKNPGKVVTSDLPEEGLITVRYNETYRAGFGPIAFDHILTIRTKDNKSKLTITNIEAPLGTLEVYCLKKDRSVRGMYQELYDGVGKSTDELIKSYEKSLRSKQDNDW